MDIKYFQQALTEFIAKVNGDLTISELTLLDLLSILHRTQEIKKDWDSQGNKGYRETL